MVAPVVQCGHAYAHVSTSRTVRSVLHFPLGSYNKRLEEIAHTLDLRDRSELRADQDLRKRRSGGRNLVQSPCGLYLKQQSSGRAAAETMNSRDLCGSFTPDGRDERLK
jgi:hypothetical protein